MKTLSEIVVGVSVLVAAWIATPSRRGSLEALDQDFHLLEKERHSLSQAVDTGLLRKYDTLRERKGGIAVSPVVRGVCRTCHLRIPPQEFNELIQGDKLMTCPNCTRLIYWGDDERYKTEEGAKNEGEA